MSKALDAMGVTSAVVPYGWWIGRDRSFLPSVMIQQRRLQEYIHLPE